MNDRIYFRPLIPLLVALMGGILLGSRLTGLVAVFSGLVLVGGGSSLVCFYDRKPAFFMPLMLFVSLGYLSIQPWLSARIPGNHVRHFADTQRWDICGRIDNQPWQMNNRTRFDLRVASLGADEQTRTVSGLLRVTVVGNAPDIHMGDKIRFNSRMRSTSNFNNPGGFDYKRYMAFKGVLVTAYLRGDRITILERAPAAGVFQTIERVRRSFAKLVEKTGSAEAQAVLKALIIGDRHQISEDTRQNFNRAGVAHLLAISGLHVGIVATVSFALLNWLAGWIKPLLWRAWTRKTAALLSLLPVAAYGLVAGLSPSTQRAVLMVFVFLMTFVLSREQDSINTLALAAMVILIADPPSLFSISFQLSFVTVFAIIYGFASVQKWELLRPARDNPGWTERLAVRLITFFLVSLFAIGGSLPLVAYYFNQISLVGLAANFLVVPLVGFLTIPLGLLAFFISPLSITVAAWCLHAGALALSAALGIVGFFASVPFAAVKTITPSLLEIVCFYALGGAVLNLFRTPAGGAVQSQAAPAPIAGANRRRPENTVPLAAGKEKSIFRLVAARGLNGVSARKWTQVVVVLTLFVLGADGCYWLYQRFWHADLRITIVDVGDGSAALLEIPGGHTIMIDGGGFSDNASFDVGARIIAPLLWQKKIGTVDLLILSHPNSDHLNGLIYLADHFNVTALWANGEPRSTLGYRKLMEVCARRGIHLPAYDRLARKHLINGVELDLLYPPRDFLDRKDAAKRRNYNNNSLVVKVTFDDTAVLFPGDIMAAAEKQLVNLAGERLSSTVLIAPHHGSRSSNSPTFLAEVDPQVVIVSCGRNSRFKFPHPEVLERIRDLGADIFRTDTSGAVQLTSDGRQLMINPYIVNNAARTTTYLTY